MKFVALNENIAAFLPAGPTREADPRAALNKLMTVNSWRLLIEFLKDEGCNELFAKREKEPLVERADYEEYDDRGYSHDCYYFEPLAGSLKARIDKDASIDYLDGLTKKDLLEQGDVYELYIPELLSYACDISALLTLAAVALGSEAPDDLVSDFDFHNTDLGSDEEFFANFERYTNDYFGAHGPLKIVSFNRGQYWPATDFGPYLSCGPFDLHIFDSNFSDSEEDRKSGILGAHAYIGMDRGARGEDYDLFIYDSSRYNQTDAVRMMCAMIVRDIAGDTTLVPVYDDEEQTFHHSYVDEPDYDDRPQFSLDKGFQHPKFDSNFKRWQIAVQEVAEAAIFDGRVALCPICGTPIITKSDRSRVEYCCTSHKTVASKRRRELAHQLCMTGVPIEDAIAQIGLEYESSVKKWYQEATRFTNPAQ